MDYLLEVVLARRYSWGAGAWTWQVGGFTKHPPSLLSLGDLILMESGIHDLSIRVEGRNKKEALPVGMNPSQAPHGYSSMPKESTSQAS